MNNRNKQRGFTLAELMITIAVLAIIASMAAPSMVGLVRSTQTKTDARKLVDLLQQARSEAIFKQRNQSVTLSSSTTDGVQLTYQTVSGTNSASGATAASSAASSNSAVGGWGKLDNVQLINGPATITFGVMGQMTEPTAQTCITVQNLKDASKNAYVQMRTNGTIYYDARATNQTAGCPTNTANTNAGSNNGTASSPSTTTS